MDFETQIAGFRDFANERLKAQVLTLNRYKHSHMVSGKLAKIKIFNEQLDVLKNELNTRMHSIIAGSEKSDHARLNVRLLKVYNDCISEYMFQSFIRDEA